jgi:WD40 repeat protein
MIADLIFPFVSDRPTWNSVYSASKELCQAGKKMTPPWPNTVINLDGEEENVRFVAFSPSGSQLAYDDAHELIARVRDRWGKDTLLLGHNGHVRCLEYSPGGEYLASGSDEGNIRLWHASPMTSRGPDITLEGDHQWITTLSFSRTDSNLLASGGSMGTIRLWKIKEGACIHSFDYDRGYIQSLFFTGGEDMACCAVAGEGSIIQLWRAEGSTDFSRAISVGAGGLGNRIQRAAFSTDGTLLAAVMDSSGSTALALFERETMTMTMSVPMPGLSTGCLAFSPDSKQLAAVMDSSGSTSLVLFEGETMTMTMSVPMPGLSTGCLAFSPDSKQVASCQRMGGGIRLVLTDVYI